MKKLLLAALFCLPCSLAEAQWGNFNINNGNFSGQPWGGNWNVPNYPTLSRPAPRYPVMMPYSDTKTGRIGTRPIYPVYPPVYQPVYPQYPGFGFGY